MASIFVPIEGIDGCGKTSTAQEVVKALCKRGIDTIFINKKQTSGYPNLYLTRFMKGLKSSLWDAEPNDPVSDVPEEVWLYLHASWYKMTHVNLIEPLLNADKCVVMDGWYYKFLARHLVNGKFDFNHSRRVLAGLPLGDPVIFLDVSPDICWSRRESFRASELGAHGQVKSDSPQNRYLSYQGSVRKIFLEFSEAPNWHVIQADSLSIESIVQIIVNIIITHIDQVK